MKRWLRNDHGRLRNGWWILAFVAVFLASQLAYRPLSRELHALGATTAWQGPLQVGFLLLVTWICLRLRGEPLANVGLRFNRAWLAQCLAGAGVGALAILAATASIRLAGGVRFNVDPAASLPVVANGAWFFLWIALLEELLFRGFLFQRMVDGLGESGALWLMGALFAFAHWGNPGMEGATLAWASIDTVLGALVLGLLYLRTRSLALPIGYHFGWNWVQGSVLGFDVSGLDQAGWLLPQLQDKPQWLTGGAFGPEASVCAVLVDALLVLVLWRWRRSAASTAPRVSMA